MSNPPNRYSLRVQAEKLLTRILWMWRAGYIALHVSTLIVWIWSSRYIALCVSTLIAWIWSSRYIALCVSTLNMWIRSWYIWHVSNLILWMSKSVCMDLYVFILMVSVFSMDRLDWHGRPQNCHDQNLWLLIMCHWKFNVSQPSRCIIIRVSLISMHVVSLSLQPALSQSTPSYDNSDRGKITMAHTRWKNAR